MPKFETVGVPGIFLGWKLHNGNHWSKSYIVAKLSDFEQGSGPSSRIYIYTTPKITWDASNVSFPLRQAMDRQRNQIKNIRTDMVQIAEVVDSTDAPTTAEEQERVVSPEVQVAIEAPSPAMPNGSDVGSRVSSPTAASQGGETDPTPIFHPTGSASSSSGGPVPPDTSGVTAGVVDDGRSTNDNVTASVKETGTHHPTDGGGEEGHSPSLSTSSASSPTESRVLTDRDAEAAEALVAKGLVQPYTFDGSFEVILPGDPKETRVKRKYNSARPPGIDPGVWVNKKEVPDNAKRGLLRKYKDAINKANMAVSSGRTTAAPISTVERRIVEFCCSSESKIGDQANHGDHKCHVVRITEKEDGTSRKGKRYAIKACKGRNPTLLWSSIPCVAGCRYNIDINRHKSEEAWKRWESQYQEFRKLLETLEALCRTTRRCKGKIAIEWPKSCTHWQEPRVQALIKTYGLKIAEVHGCAVGVTGRNGRPVNKPWFIATDDDELFNSLNRLRCPGCAQHDKCENKVAKATEAYSDYFAQTVHQAWRSTSGLLSSARSKQGGSPKTPGPSEPKGVSDTAPLASVPAGGGGIDPWPNMPVRSRRYAHRPHLGLRRLQHLAVARPVGRKELESKPKARQATEKEYNNLLEKGAWDMTPRPKREVAEEARR